MHGMHWLEQALILLLAAAAAVPVFTHFRLGAVLAYLCAGAVIGPASSRPCSHACPGAGMPSVSSTAASSSWRWLNSASCC